MLPSFLQTTSSTTDATPSTLGRVIAAEFKHKTPPGNAQVYWWPETQSDGPIDVAVLFIPGTIYTIICPLRKFVLTQRL